MQRKYTIAAIALCSLAGIPLLYKALDQSVRIYFQYRVGTLCNKLKPGTPLAEAKRMIQKAGLERLESANGSGWGSVARSRQHEVIMSAPWWTMGTW